MISDDSWSGNRWCLGQDGCIIWDKYTCLRYNHTLRPFFDSTARQRLSQFKNWGMWNRIGWVVFLDYLMGTWHLLWKVKAGYVQCRRTSPLRGSLLTASAARFGPSALKVRSFWMDYIWAESVVPIFHSVCQGQSPDVDNIPQYMCVTNVMLVFLKRYADVVCSFPIECVSLFTSCKR